MAINEFAAVGVTFENRQDFKELYSDSVKMESDNIPVRGSKKEQPENPYDKNAIAVKTT